MAVRCDAQTEVPHADFEQCSADNIRNGRRNTGVDLCWVILRRVVLVVEVDEEDIGYQRRG